MRTRDGRGTAYRQTNVLGCEGATARSYIISQAVRKKFFVFIFVILCLCFFWFHIFRKVFGCQQDLEFGIECADEVRHTGNIFLD